MKFFLFAFLSFTICGMQAQDLEIEIVEEAEQDSSEALSFAIIEDAPIVPGCDDTVKYNNHMKQIGCFNQYAMGILAKNFQIPEEARKLGVQGKCFIKFIIEKDGSINEITVVRGVEQAYANDSDEKRKVARLIDEEGIRVVKLIKVIEPAKIKGKPVRVQYMLPINVRLQ